MAKSLQRLRLRPTGLGAKGIVFWTVIFLAWLATPYANLFFLLLCLLSVLAPLSVWWTARNMNGIGAVIENLGPVPAEQRGEAVVHLVGTRKQPALGVEVEMCVAVQNGGSRRRAVRRTRSGFTIEARPHRDIVARTPRLPRGVHVVQGAWLISSTPLGLIRARRRIPCPTELAVHPQPASLPAVRDRSALLASLRGDSMAASGDFGPSGLREFREGDEARHVDWRASARKTELVVREWESDAIQGIEICLDRRCDDEELEDALELATALLFVAREDKEVFVMTTQDHSGRYGDGKAPYDEALRYFAACTPLESTAPPPPSVGHDVLRLPIRKERAR